MKKEDLKVKKQKLDLAVSEFMSEYERELDALEFLNDLVTKKRKELEDIYKEYSFK